MCGSVDDTAMFVPCTAVPTRMTIREGRTVASCLRGKPMSTLERCPNIGHCCVCCGCVYVLACILLVT